MIPPSGCKFRATDSRRNLSTLSVDKFVGKCGGTGELPAIAGRKPDCPIFRQSFNQLISHDILCDRGKGLNLLAES
jgi:hypothetical protein